MKYQLPVIVMLAVAVLTGCSNDPSEPDQQAPQAYQYTRDMLHPQGNVVETDNGYTVDGTLMIDNEQNQTTFDNANLDVEFDADGKLQSVSGSVQVPSPSKDVEFADPIQADVGFFTGKFLNENRDFPILLKDDISYFVFHVGVAVEMKVKDADSGSEASVSVKAPVGGTVLMISDFNDPMYFVYGAKDLAGAFGSGRSLHMKIPYVPIRGSKDIFTFDGTDIRTGTFTLAKLFSCNGTVIEGLGVGLGLLGDPIELNVEAGYYYGVNGSMDLSLPVKDVVEFNMPIGEGSAAVRGEASTVDGVYAAAFIDGLADPDLAWWPNLIPIKPDGQLLAQGILTSTGRFDMHLAGDFGIYAFGDPEKLAGDFHLTADALTLSGAVIHSDARYEITGTIDDQATTVSVVPPVQLKQRISDSVNSELDKSIADAEKAWNDLQEATKDYEFELSLRGLRPLIPDVVDAAKSEISKQIASQLAKHSGQPYYNSLKSFLHSKDDKYYAALDNLKKQAQATTDSDAWRAAIESALRTAAGYKYFDETYVYKVAGITVKTVHIKVRILSDANVSKLTTAANNVKYIKETSDIKIKAQQVYDQIPDKQIFERVKDDIQNGVVMIPDLGEIGYVQPHGSSDIEIFAMIDGQRQVVGNTNIFDLAQMSAALAEVMVKILIAE
jgi:hypothetical protein